MVKIAGLDSNNEFEAESVKDHIKALAASAVDVSGLASQVSGVVVHQTVADRLDIDLGVSVNEISEVTGPTDVYFKDVTTSDGRINPDGMGTLLTVAKGAEMLTWPGGAVVYGAPPVGRSAMASLVRVGGAVTVVWPPDVVTSTAPGVTAQIAEIEQIIGGEVEVQPGGTVMQEAWPSPGAVPAVFVNPYSRPTSSALVLTVGEIEQSAFAGESVAATVRHRPGGLKDYILQASARLDPPGEPLKSQDGWLIAVAPGPVYGDARVTRALAGIRSRVATSTQEEFVDGTWGIILQYNAENPHWWKSEWEGGAYLSYDEKGNTDGWEHGMVLTSGLALPMRALESEYESLGITLPGTFHRASEFDTMRGWADGE